MYILNENSLEIHTIADVPEAALAFVRPQIAQAIGGDVSDMFPAFSQSFPLTTAKMESDWSKPKLVLKEMGYSWLPTIFLEQESMNLFFNSPHPIYAEEPYFDVSMLPTSWRGLYRSMESFNITSESSFSPVGWKNTLLPTGIGIKRFCGETNIKKAAVLSLKKKLNIETEEQLRCWMMTEAGDSLWIDEQHRDGIVYHVSLDDFSNAFPLFDSNLLMDKYLAHVVGGQAPRDFNFRILK